MGHPSSGSGRQNRTEENKTPEHGCSLQCTAVLSLTPKAEIEQSPATADTAGNVSLALHLPPLVLSDFS